MSKSESRVQIMLSGASGALGQAIERSVDSDPEAVVVARYDRTSGFDGQPLGDVVVDVSHFSQTPKVLDFAQAQRRAVLIGTTALDADTQQQIEQASRHIAICVASNFSLGALVLGQLVQVAAAALPQFEVSIQETHHMHKKDAPSGTALTLQALINEVGDRPIAIESVREGEVVGVHEVTFQSATERLVLRHDVCDRQVFAQGAVWMAKRLLEHGPGLYRPEALLA